MVWEVTDYMTLGTIVNQLTSVSNELAVSLGTITEHRDKVEKQRVPISLIS